MQKTAGNTLRGAFGFSVPAAIIPDCKQSWSVAGRRASKWDFNAARAREPLAA